VDLNGVGLSVAGAGRHQLFFALFLLASLNAFVSDAARAIEDAGWLGAALNLFGLSAIVWLALAAGLAILWQSRTQEPLRRFDILLAGLVLLSALLPAPRASSVALTCAALWAIFTSEPGTPLRRAGIVFLAISGALVWGRLILALFSGPLLWADAILVAGLLDAQHSGNVLWYNEVADGVVVTPGCSSMAGLSLALVFWATVNQFFEVRFSWRAAAYCAAALTATVAVNVLRIGAILHWPDRFEELHDGWGYQLSLWATLLLVVVICMWGARREAFGPR